MTAEIIAFPNARAARRRFSLGGAPWPASPFECACEVVRQHRSFGDLLQDVEQDGEPFAWAALAHQAIIGMPAVATPGEVSLRRQTAFAALFLLLEADGRASAS